MECCGLLQIEVEIHLYVCRRPLGALIAGKRLRGMHVVRHPHSSKIRIERKKERNPLRRGHVDDIGSAWVYNHVGGRGVKANCPECPRNYPAPPSLCDGGALRGVCRARPMRVCGGPLLMGGMMVRWGCIRV